MNALPQNTKRRLKKIPQNSAVWEGDRRSLGSLGSQFESETGMDGECILWVDGTEGTVRAMDIVPPQMGLEAIVRTLLRAIESPHHPSTPIRPQKIVVCDREIQFFLRGALQGLDIKIEYVSELPLIDRLFDSFEEMGTTQTPALPPQYANILEELAYEVWEDGPWEVLADSDILSLELNGYDTGTLYACVMGNMSTEYGVLFYRSLDSLKQFRSAALSEDSPESLEKAFLSQDCWFLNYEDEDEEDDEDWELDELEELGEVTPFFGSVHPFEGMRGFLDAEEAEIIYIALTALLKFCNQHRRQLCEDPIPQTSKTYKIPHPQATDKKQKISVKVSTLPDLTTELMGMDYVDSDLSQEINIPIVDDFIPDGSLITLGKVPWELTQSLKEQKTTYYQSLNLTAKGEGLPSVLIQTSRPKAQTLIETIKNSGGLKGICFNPGNDPFSGNTYDLGMLQTQNGNLYIFAEYPHNLAKQSKALQKWRQSCEQTKGYCSLIITMGVTGASRGNPQPKDMLAVFEAKSITGEELGMGTLQLMPQFEL